MFQVSDEIEVLTCTRPAFPPPLHLGLLPAFVGEGNDFVWCTICWLAMVACICDFETLCMVCCLLFALLSLQKSCVQISYPWYKFTLLLMILRNWISGMRPVFAGSKVLQIKQLAMTMKIMMGAMKSYSKTANKVVSSGSARRWQETRRRYSLNEREACLDSDSHHVMLMYNLNLNNFNFLTWCPQTLAQSLPLSAPHLPGGSESIQMSKNLFPL